MNRGSRINHASSHKGPHLIIINICLGGGGGYTSSNLLGRSIGSLYTAECITVQAFTYVKTRCHPDLRHFFQNNLHLLMRLLSVFNASVQNLLSIKYITKRLTTYIKPAVISFIKAIKRCRRFVETSIGKRQRFSTLHLHTHSLARVLFN